MKALLPLLVVLLASCTSTTVDEFRQGATGINSDESVVILGSRHSSKPGGTSARAAAVMGRRRRRSA